MKREALLKALLPLLLLLLPGAAAAQEPRHLKVSYLKRPPYYWTENGQPRGFLLELTRRILEQAGVAATYAALPPNRILEELRQNQSPSCSIGWFKNPEREAFAHFSLPRYLIFSKSVPQEMIEDINSVITALTDQQHLLAPSPQ